VSVILVPILLHDDWQAFFAVTGLQVERGRGSFQICICDGSDFQPREAIFELGSDHFSTASDLEIQLLHYNNTLKEPRNPELQISPKRCPHLPQARVGRPAISGIVGIETAAPTR
jgi:hypothetical protein